MKYRRLTPEELKELENEFIEFLAANTVTGRDWEKLKKENPEKVDALVDEFSDIVLQKVLEKINYLELRTPKDWKVFFCANDQIELIALSAPPDNNLDLTREITGDDLNRGGAEIYKADKKYDKSREKEIFEMIENGCSISNAKVFEMMYNLLE